MRVSPSDKCVFPSDDNEGESPIRLCELDDQNKVAKVCAPLQLSLLKAYPGEYSRKVLTKLSPQWIDLSRREMLINHRLLRQRGPTALSAVTRQHPEQEQEPAKMVSQNQNINFF